LKKALADGADALAAARVAAATQAYELALAIDRTNTAAQHGLKRAAAVEGVQALIVEARRAADAGNWTAAAAGYRHALALDAEATEARAGLTLAERQVADAEYQTAMAGALKALNLRRFAEARTDIARALAVRPKAAEPRDVAARVNQAIAGTRIEDLRVEADNHERNERWNDALTVYESILGRNSTLLFAREGRDRVTPRVKLDARLTDFNARPERLGYLEIREAARRAVNEGQQIASPGPVLRSEIAQVEALLATAEKPVRVALESDAATQVVIYHFGALGAFTRREVELPPGIYTVLGTRTGFRDVRQELKVRPGESPAALIVRCEDPI
jgi:tetratricopeptide (TPR) repeat protein